jgi:hypothetical protein
MIQCLQVHEEDPQTETSFSSDLMDPPQVLLFPVGWSMPTWVSVVAHHQHDHHRTNHIHNLDMNHDMNEWTHHH